MQSVDSHCDCVDPELCPSQNSRPKCIVIIKRTKNQILMIFFLITESQICNFINQNMEKINKQQNYLNRSKPVFPYNYQKYVCASMDNPNVTKTFVK